MLIWNALTLVFFTRAVFFNEKPNIRSLTFNIYFRLNKVGSTKRLTIGLIGYNLSIGLLHPENNGKNWLDIGKNLYSLYRFGEKGHTFAFEEGLLLLKTWVIWSLSRIQHKQIQEFSFSLGNCSVYSLCLSMALFIGSSGSGWDFYKKLDAILTITNPSFGIESLPGGGVMRDGRHGSPLIRHWRGPRREIHVQSWRGFKQIRLGHSRHPLIPGPWLNPRGRKPGFFHQRHAHHGLTCTQGLFVKCHSAISNWKLYHLLHFPTRRRIIFLSRFVDITRLLNSTIVFILSLITGWWLYFNQFIYGSMIKS